MDSNSPDFLLKGVLWYVAFLFSTVCHEAAHALASYKMGDSTAYEGGQVTLDPLPHIKREPWGMVLIPILSYAMGGWMFGWASAPYNPYWAISYPRKAALMALAGPAANFALAIIAAILLNTVLPTIGGEEIAGVTTRLLTIFVNLNLLLGLYNLLPAPPLDGSSVIMLFMNHETARRYMEFIHQPWISFIGFFVVFNFGGRLIMPLFFALRDLLSF